MPQIRNAPMIVRTLVAALVITFSTVQLAVAKVPLGGFIPFVGIGMTDEHKTLDDLDLGSIPFIADAAVGLGSPLLNSYMDIALLDSGAATHIITQQAFNGFNIQGNGLRGENLQVIGGATGTILMEINDAMGIYASGFGDLTFNGTTYTPNSPNQIRGQTSIATLTAPSEWGLPNILGLPMVAQHAVAIRNSEPLIFQHNGRTVRTPQIDFVELGTGATEGITRRAPLKLKPGIGFIQGPQFVYNLDIGDVLGGGGGITIHDNPASPSVVQDSNGNGGGLFLDVDMANGTRSFQDKEFLFDTGADLTVVSELTAARLGFDAILDTPDFILEVEGSGGVSGGVPGFYIDELNIDTVGGTFTLHNVPVAVLDVTNPNDPGNVIDGILGMHLFTGRDLVIDANPSRGQGGIGPSLFISNPVTTTHVWSSTIAQTTFNTATNWSANGTPDISWVAELRNTAVASQFVSVSGNQTVNQLVVAGTANHAIALQLTGTQTFTTFGETRIEQGGTINLIGANTRFDAQFINIEGGALRGNGTVFVGTGPINGAVRNLGGRVEPGNTLGTMSIIGDFSNLDDGTLAIQLGGTTASTQYDVLAVSRFAFLDGTLEVTFVNGFLPAIGNTFTFLTTAADGVFGEFENLNLPGGYQWDVEYLSGSVRLKVLGLGTPGDFDGDGDVDGRDLIAWQRNPSLGNLADWQTHYGNGALNGLVSVPEPTGLVLIVCGVGVLLCNRRHA
jgi:hypothetical protein